MTSTATMTAWGDMSPGQPTAAMTSSPTILIAHSMVLKSCKTLLGRSKFQAKAKQLREVNKFKMWKGLNHIYENIRLCYGLLLLSSYIVASI